MIHIVCIANILTALKTLEDVCRCVQTMFSTICKRTGMRMILRGRLRFHWLFVKYFLMHMTRLSGFKSDLKYGLVAIWKPLVENVIVTEVAAGLHVIFGVAVPLELLDNKQLAAILQHQTGDLLFDGLHLRLLHSLARERGVIRVQKAVPLSRKLT